MDYYSKYVFSKNPESETVYLLDNVEGFPVEKFDLGAYKTGNYVGRKYIRMTEPRSLNMRRFFAYTFEMQPNVPFTSTEKLNSNNQTFGDGKKLGSNDLILFQFSDDLSKLEVYFLNNQARNLVEKKANFNAWVKGETLKKSFA